MKKLTCTIIVIFAAVVSFAQKEVVEELQESRIDSIIDDFLFVEDDSDEILGLLKETKNYQFLYWRTNYDSKTFYAGREIGSNQYNLSSQIFYLHSKGFYVGLAGSWYSDLDPGYRTTVLSFGYGKGLKKIKFLRFRSSFDLYFYNNDDPDYDPIYTSSLNLGTTLKSKIVSTRFDAAFLLGKEFGTQFNWDIYSKITLLKFGKYDKLQFEPEISFFFGSETVEYDLSTYLYDEFPDIAPSYYYEDVFGLLNAQISIPLSLSIKNFDFEFAWKRNLPRTNDYAYDYPKTSLFSFSVGYIFNL